MQELYYKLKELVPNCSTKNKMSKTELLQNVIDYIFDLQDTLDLESDDEESKAPLTESFQTNKMEYEVIILQQYYYNQSIVLHVWKAFKYLFNGN